VFTSYHIYFDMADFLGQIGLLGALPAATSTR
jgi:hypothetical protein